MLATVRHFLSLIRFSHTVFALPFALLAAVMAWHGRWRTASADGHSRWQELAGHPAVHGVCPQRGDGVQSAGRSQARRRESADGGAAFAGGDSERRAGDGVCRRRAARRSSPARCCFCRIGCRCIWPCRCWRFCWATATRSGSRRWRTSGWGRRWRCRRWRRGSPFAARRCMQQPADLLPALVLGGAVWAWVAGFDIIYACQDFDFDRAGAAAQRAGAAGRGGRLTAGGGVPFGDNSAAGRAAAGVTRRLAGFSGPASRPWPRCWCTSTPWCGPTTWPA